MTSKNWLCKKSLLLDNFKRHAWLAAIYSVILFFALPVTALLQAQRITRNYITSMDIDSIKSIIAETFENGGIIFLAIPAAILAAAVMFHYINSKKQTDFYHSLPIKRTRLFFNNIAVGFASFIVPYLIFTLIAALAYVMNGLGAYMSASTILCAVGAEILSFSVTFSLSLFSFMLCGNVIVGLLGFGVLTFYAPALLGIIFTYMEVFFQTFYESVFYLENILFHSSPVLYLAFKSPSSYTPGRVIFYIIFALALAALSLILYLKRGSEAAGKAIAFKVAKPIIKYPIVFLATCTFGILFRSMGDQGIGWTIFGFLCGAFLSHAVIEIIYELDFKALFKNLTPMAVFCGVFAVLYLFVETDLIGYDSYLPDSSKVQSVSVNISNKYDYNSGRFFGSGYEGREKRQLERMTFSTESQIASVLAMARDSIEESENGGHDYSEHSYEWLGVGFNLKSGRTVYRSYYVNSDVFNSYFKQLYDSEGFKENYFDMLYFKNNPQEFEGYRPQSVQCTDLLSNEYAAVEKTAFLNELSDAVCADILQTPAEYIDRELPVFLLYFNMVKPDGSLSYNTRFYMPVYGCFERTLELLAQQGITPVGESYIADLSGIDNASITLRRSGLTMEISSSEQINALAPYLVSNMAVDYDLLGSHDSNYMRYSVYVTNEDNSVSSNYYFKNDTPPAFVAQYFLEHAEDSEKNTDNNYMPGAMDSFTQVVYPEDHYVGSGSEIVY